jgi:hypothetical protein
MGDLPFFWAREKETYTVGSPPLPGDIWGKNIKFSANAGWEAVPFSMGTIGSAFRYNGESAHTFSFVYNMECKIFMPSGDRINHLTVRLFKNNGEIFCKTHVISGMSQVFSEIVCDAKKSDLFYMTLLPHQLVNQIMVGYPPQVYNELEAQVKPQ